MYPASRLRRLRVKKELRRMVEETALARDDLIMPLFVVPGENVRDAVASMPGIWRVSVDNLAGDVEKLVAAGVSGVLLFGVPEKKDETGTQAYSERGVVQRAVSMLKKKFPQLVIVTDACLCSYTTHGHCGLVKEGSVDNDATLEVLARVAVSHARAGADIVAPSAMMDGQVREIRVALDGEGYQGVAVMSYSAKYASSFYGPFREGADCAPQFGDRKGYQMNPANVREAFREVKADLDEGADIVMVKPALAYLDVIAGVRKRFDCPVAAYNVSGEYSMVKAAAASGWLSEREAVLEILTAIKRAGADVILTYHAADVAGWLT